MAKFKVRAVLVGSDQVQRNMLARSLKGRVISRLRIGYSASYAVHVHENMEGGFRFGGPRFLSRPFRRLGREMRSLMVRYLQVGKRSLEFAILNVGKWFIRETRDEVPMDTGHLRSTAYVTAEGGRTEMVGRQDLGWIQPRGVRSNR